MQSTDDGSVGQDAETVEQLNESGDLRQLLRPFQVSVCHALVIHSVMQSCTVMTPVLSTGHCHVICDLRTKESSLGPEICDQFQIPNSSGFTSPTSVTSPKATIVSTIYSRQINFFQENLHFLVCEFG